MNDLTLRKPLADFAQLMERTLRSNDHKDGFDAVDCDYSYLMGRLQQEIVELDAAMRRKNGTLEFIRREAADVANFAMMIAHRTTLPIAKYNNELTDYAAFQREVAGPR